MGLLAYSELDDALGFTVMVATDSFVSPTFGNKEGLMYSGHFECSCYGKSRLVVRNS